MGQLNFFRWALEKQILNYISNNLEQIENDMNMNIRKPENKVSKSKKKTIFNQETSSKKPERRKRKELSISATNTINKHNVNIAYIYNIY